MTRWSPWLFVMSTCIACGAHSTNEPLDLAAGAGGRATSAAGGSVSAGNGDGFSAGTGVGPSENGGVSSSGGDAGVAMSDAGGPGYVPHIGSGTRNCDNASFCFGLNCYAPPSFEPNVCVARCEAESDCEPSEACVRSVRLEPTCYERCDSPTDCEYHFDCVDFTGDGQAICFPTGWAGRLDELAD